MCKLISKAWTQYDIQLEGDFWGLTPIEVELELFLKRNTDLLYKKSRFHKKTWAEFPEQTGGDFSRSHTIVVGKPILNRLLLEFLREIKIRYEERLKNYTVLFVPAEGLAACEW